MIGIYKIENKINGKVYIGQSNDIDRRWNRHISDAEKIDYPLYRAIRKYGAENFDFTIIQECPEEEMNELEIYYIEKFQSFIEYGKGYNLTTGGGGCAGYSHSDEYKENLSKRVSGELNPMYGRTGEDSAVSRKVVCLNTREIFSSMEEASYSKNCSRSNLNSVCLNPNKRKTTTDKITKEKLTWRYYEDYIGLSEDEIEEIIISSKIVKKTNKKVICITTNISFESLKEASKFYSVNVNSVISVCKGRQSYAGELEDGTKLTWKYLE